MAQQWDYTVVGKATFGGFDAYLLAGEARIFVAAGRWKGKQPRIVLERYPMPVSEVAWGHTEQGFNDWLPLMRRCSERHTFPGDDIHANNLVDQWLGQSDR